MKKWFCIILKKDSGYITAGIEGKACFDEEVKWSDVPSFSSSQELLKYTENKIKQLKGNFVWKSEPRCQIEPLVVSGFFELV